MHTYILAGLKPSSNTPGGYALPVHDIRDRNLLRSGACLVRLIAFLNMSKDQSLSGYGSFGTASACFGFVPASSQSGLMHINIPILSPSR